MESRLTDLEIRHAHQEAALEAINETLRLQQRSIDELQAELTRVKQQLRALQGGDVAPMAEETPPPHY